MGTDKTTVKSYDDYAVRWAERMRSGANIAHTYLEKPAMYKKIPNLKGKNVLCIGCGTGEECEKLKKMGAKNVVGIDISEGLINYAEKSYPHLEFYVMDMENISFKGKVFDFIYSSLTMHYVKDWRKTLKGVYRVLSNEGSFLFSTHHPVKWGSKVKRDKDKNSFLMGYVKYVSGACDTFGDYQNTRKITDVWFNEFKVSYYHRPLSAIIKDILGSNFSIVDFLEPKPILGVKKL